MTLKKRHFTSSLSQGIFSSVLWAVHCQSMALHTSRCELRHAVIYRENQDLQILECLSRIQAEGSAHQSQKAQRSTWSPLGKILLTLVGRFFDDRRSDGVRGRWVRITGRGRFLFFWGIGFLGVCTNARFGFIGCVFVGNQGSCGFLQEEKEIISQQTFTWTADRLVILYLVEHLKT